MSPQRPLGRLAMTTYEAAHADLRARTAYVATAPQTCLNGCQWGAGDERGPVPCEGHDQICQRCADRLDTWLRRIPETYALLPTVKDHGTVPADPGTMRTKKPDAPAPMRLEVVDLLDTRPGRGVLGVVHPWAEVVRDERRLLRRCQCEHSRPAHAGPCGALGCACRHFTPGPANVYAETQLLIAHLPWAVQQDWISDMYGEVKALTRVLADAVGDRRAKPVGWCVALVSRPGVPADQICGGALIMDRTGYGVTCLGCGGHHEANAELRELGLIVGLIDDDGNQREVS